MNAHQKKRGDFSPRKRSFVFENIPFIKVLFDGQLDHHGTGLRFCRLQLKKITDFGICECRLYGLAMSSRPLHSNDYEILVALLKNARKEAGLTQVEVASRLGVEQSFVSKVERRERRLDVTELRVYCAVLGIGLSEFVSQFEATLPLPNKRTVRVN